MESSVDQAAGGGPDPGWRRVSNEPPPRDPTEPLPRDDR
jgi:hypothetical protein